MLENISLSFYPGAKIGVLGSNGAGKSTPAAGSWPASTTAISGEARLTPGFTVGYLPQEPQLDPAKDVNGNVMDGVAAVQAIIDRFNEVHGQWATPTPTTTRSAREQAELEDKIDAANGWDLDRNVEIAMDALRCPPDDADVTTLSGGERRRVALCRLLLAEPDLLLLDEPTNHLDAESVAWLERHLQEYHGTVVAVTHDRYFLDNVAQLDPRARPRHGHPVRGQLLELARAEGGAPRAGGEVDEARRRTLERELEWVRMAPEGPPGQGQGPPHRVRQAARRGRGRRRGDDRHAARSRSRPGRASATRSSRSTHLRKGYGDRLLIDDLSFSLPPAGIVGVIGPNGAGKTTLFRMLVGQEQPDAGTLTIGDTVAARATSTSAATRSTPTRRSTRRSPAASTT